MNVKYDGNRLSLEMVKGGVYNCVPYKTHRYEQYGEGSGSILSHSSFQSSTPSTLHKLTSIACILTGLGSMTFARILFLTEMLLHMNS
jgi:hypothetical protein